MTDLAANDVRSAAWLIEQLEAITNDGAGRDLCFLTDFSVVLPEGGHVNLAHDDGGWRIVSY